MLQLEEGERRDLELIVACECSGSVAHVHQKCMRVWMEKQMGAGGKRGFCEICKAEIHFKMVKSKFCDCRVVNLRDLSPCNVVCLVTEMALIAIVGVVNYYSDRIVNFDLLRYVLTALLVVLIFTFLMTLLLIIKETFVRTLRTMERIYSITEAEELGLREPRLPKTPRNYSTRSQKLITKSSSGHAKKLKRNRNSVNPRPNNPYDSINPVQIIMYP